VSDEPAPNPLAEGLTEYRSAEPCLMVIFGATGDLANRKLLPAIYSLACQGYLPAGFSVVGAALPDISVEEFRKTAGKSIREHARIRPIDEGVLRTFLASLEYVRVDFGSDSDFKALKRRLDDMDSNRHTAGNRVFYCATPPPTYKLIAQRLGGNGLVAT
jgi:glucose-6-phosphate 1-dehydrogenase